MGRSAVAPPSSTANRSSDIVPSSTRRLWMKATPENTVAMVIGSRVRAVRSVRITVASAPESTKSAPEVK